MNRREFTLAAAALAAAQLPFAPRRARAGDRHAEDDDSRQPRRRLGPDRPRLAAAMQSAKLVSVGAVRQQGRRRRHHRPRAVRQLAPRATRTR